MKREKVNKHPDWQMTSAERIGYYFGLISPYTMSGLMQSFLTAYLLLSGIKPEISAVMLLVMKLIDGFDDLLFGWVIDHFRPEKNPKLRKIVGEGRFMPWYKLIWPVMPLGLIGLYSMPMTLSLAGKIAWVCVFYFITDVGYSFMDISMSSMQTTVTGNVQERDQFIMRGMITLFLVMTPVSFLATLLQSTYVGLSYRVIAYIFVALGIIMIIPMLTRVKEHAYTGKEDIVSAAGTESAENLREDRDPFFRSLGMALRNRNLVAYYGGKMLESMTATTDALGIIGAFYLFGNELVSTVPGIVGTVVMLVLLPFMPKIYEKFDRHRVFMVLTPVNIVISVILFLAGPRSIMLYIVLMCLAKLPASIAGGCDNFIKPQVIEYGKYKTGFDCTGIQASLSTFSAVFSNAFPGAISLALLASAGFISVEAESFAELAAMNVVQPESAINALWFITAGFPVIGTILKYICNFFYNMNDRDVAVMIRYNNNEITREECDSLLSKKY